MILPVVDDAPIVEAQAKLIELPKVEVVKSLPPVGKYPLGEMWGAMCSQEPLDLTVIARRVDGTTSVFRARSFVLRMERTHGFFEESWKMEGVITGQELREASS